MTTLTFAQGSGRAMDKQDSAVQPEAASKSSARRPLLAVISTCLAERSGWRILSAARIADLVGVPEATATQALRLLAVRGQVEAVTPAAGQNLCYWRARRS